MKINDVIEWIQIADDDLYSAKTLNESVRKQYYMCLNLSGLIRGRKTSLLIL